MLHRHFSQPPTELYRARLNIFLASVNAVWQNSREGGSVLEDDIQNLYQESLSLFLDSLDSSIISSAAEVQAGLPSDPTAFDVFSSAIMADLQVLFAEIAALDRLVSSSFNSLIGERQQVLHRSKIIGNKIADYRLYSDPELGAGYFFGDSFSSSGRIEKDSSLISEKECFHDPEEGIVLLPLEGEPEYPKIKSYIINQNSNGLAGSNFAIDTPRGHSDIEALGDNEPNTWFEYERVTNTHSKIPLVLDLTVVLESISVINHVHVNPLNFGTASPVTIVDIKTSVNGTEYVSIKDDVPLADFVSEDEENVFSLSPSSSKYSGEGFYSFTPRRAKYIHFIFQQKESYNINTINGTRLRYAIGLKDLNIIGRKFKEKGELVSTSFSANDEIKKVVLWASENPKEESSLGDVKHSVSHDDGGTWLPLQPQDRDGFEIPEIVNYNNIAEGSTVTDEPVTKLRHKVFIERKKDGFSGEVLLKEEKLDKSETVLFSPGPKIDLVLEEEPIEESLNLSLGFLGSFGCPRANTGSDIKGLSKATSLDHLSFNMTTSTRYPLPYRGVPYLKQRIRVFVDGEQWEFSAHNIDQTLYELSYSDLNENSKVYFLNRDGEELQFGIFDENDAQTGKVPAPGSKIEVCLDGDNPRLEATADGYVLNLSLSSDGNKENLRLYSMNSYSSSDTSFLRIKMSETQTVDIPVVEGTEQWGFYQKHIGKLKSLQEGQEVLNYLPYLTGNVSLEEWDSATGKKHSSPVFSSAPVGYVDGFREFYNAGEMIIGSWSFNHLGEVFLSGGIPSGRYLIIKAEAQKPVVLNNEEWEYFIDPVTGRKDTQKLILNDTIVKTKKNITRLGVSDGNSLDLLYNTRVTKHSWYNHRLVNGTVVVPSNILGDQVKLTEVPFIDGSSELRATKEIKNELVPSNATGGLITFKLKGPNINKALEDGTLEFSAKRNPDQTQAPDSQFVDEKNGENEDYNNVLSNGDWAVRKDWPTQGDVTVYVHQDDGLIEHYANYEYEIVDPGVDYRGLYSIDYENGYVHFREPLDYTSSWEFQFETTLYSALYNISQPILEEDIDSIDLENKSVRLTEQFSNRFLKLDTIDSSRPMYVKALYQYYKRVTQSLKDLEPYFSPMLKDIAFRAITKSDLEEL